MKTEKENKIYSIFEDEEFWKEQRNNPCYLEEDDSDKRWEEELSRRYKRNVKRFFLYSAVLFIVIWSGGGFHKEQKAPPVGNGITDTRIYSKAYETEPHTRTLPPIDNTIEVRVKGGKTYEADVDFEELMDQLGIDPEDIKEYIE